MKKLLLCLAMTIGEIATASGVSVVVGSESFRCNRSADGENGVARQVLYCQCLPSENDDRGSQRLVFKQTFIDSGKSREVEVLGTYKIKGQCISELKALPLCDVAQQRGW